MEELAYAQGHCWSPVGPRVPEATAAALQVVIAKLHVITVGEFLPIIASFGEAELRSWTPLSQKPDISVEARPCPGASPRAALWP
jgi:hypothetical protein